MRRRLFLFGFCFMFVVGVACWAALWPASVVAQAAPEMPSQGQITPTLTLPVPAIRLQAATFVPALGQVPILPAEPSPDQGNSSAESASPQQYLVQFRGPIRAEWRAAVQEAGATLLDYIPDYAYKVQAAPSVRLRLEQVPGVLWVGDWQPAYRLSPQTARTGMQLLRVELDELPTSAWLDGLATLGWKLIGQEGCTLVVSGEADPAALARQPGVRWISPAILPRPFNDRATVEVRANLTWYAGYQGQGQTVNVADTGLDTGIDSPLVAGDIHLDLDNRVDHLRSWPIASQWQGLLDNPAGDDGAADLNTGHGTHVAGSAVGNGAAALGLYQGVAPQARLTFQALEQYGLFNAQGHALGYEDGYYLLGLPADLTALYGEAYAWGVRIHSNSWGSIGSAAQGAYDVQAQQTDRFVWEHSDMAILFAVGNQGNDANGDGRVEYGSALAPATAKNIIAVGAVENYRPEMQPPIGYQTYGQFFGVSTFPVAPLNADPMADAGWRGMMAASGRGPTRDGRLVPQVVAPGTWVASLRSAVAQQPELARWGTAPLDAFYLYMGGTSMSAPLVAGGIALVRQAYAAYGNPRPSAALLKATLIQTARPLAGQYPAPYTEVGSIPNNDEGWGALDLQTATAAGRRYIDQAVALQTAGQAVYTYALSSASQPARFTLVWTDYPAALEAARQLVNDLDLEVQAPDGQVYLGNALMGGWSVAGGSPDRLNNVECVYLPASLAGAYTVTIRGYNIPWGPQDFALLVDGAFDYPLRLTLPLVMRNASRAPGEFRDDFSAVNGLWAVASTPTYALDYVGGEYRMRVYPDKGKLVSLPAIEHAGNTLLEVEARAISGVSQAYGLVFNFREEAGVPNYDALLLAPTGYFAVARWQGEVETDIGGGWMAAPAIITGTAGNRLSITRAGQVVEYRINDTLVLTQTGAEFTSGAGFGLVVRCYESDPTLYAEVRFDNFHLLPLGGPTIQAQHILLPRLLSGRSSSNALPPR